MAQIFMQMMFFVVFYLSDLLSDVAVFFVWEGLVLVMVLVQSGIPFDTCGLMTSQLWTIGTGGF